MIPNDNNWFLINMSQNKKFVPQKKKPYLIKKKEIN